MLEAKFLNIATRMIFRNLGDSSSSNTIDEIEKKNIEE
jgi:hypothetical protein